MIVTINSVPYIGCEDLYLYRVGTDNNESYALPNSGDFQNILKVPELVAISLNSGANDTNFYANNVKKLTDTTYSYSGSFTISGDDEEIDKLVLGKKAEGGAVLDNLASAPEVGIIYGLTKAKGEWVVRQILKATCSKADSTVDTKGESTSFQTSVININPLFGEFFGCYIREFYSSDAALTGMTMQDVLDALAANPAATFGTNYTVSFAAGDGTGSMSSVTKASGASYVLPDSSFTAPTNKVFDKWSVVIGTAAAVTKNPGDSITVSANVTCTATYKNEV